MPTPITYPLRAISPPSSPLRRPAAFQYSFDRRRVPAISVVGDEHRLVLRVVLQRRHPLLAAGPGLLDAAERRLDVHRRRGVHRQHPGLHRPPGPQPAPPAPPPPVLRDRGAP